MTDLTGEYIALDIAATILDDLDHWFITPPRIHVDENQDVILGGYGDLHRGVLHPYSAPVAIKKLRPAGPRRQRLKVAAALARELRAWERANHPNVLRLVGFHLDKSSLDCAWLAIVTWWQMEGDVLGYIDRTNADEAKRLQLATDTAAGLAYLHSCDPAICHGDIKPANTLVNSLGRAMICDFGLARVMEEAPSGLTTSGLVVGTVRYTSPEVLMDDNYMHTFESDTWAWGCLALEIVARTKPYESIRDGPSLYKAIAQERLPAQVGTIEAPCFVKSLLHRTWAIQPSSRPSMQERAAFLSRCTTGAVCPLPQPDPLSPICETMYVPDDIEVEEDWCIIAAPNTWGALDVALLNQSRLQNTLMWYAVIASRTFLARMLEDIAPAVVGATSALLA